LILIAQFFLKKLIRVVWPFFMTMQLLLTIEKFSGVRMPVNLRVVIEKTNGILKLEAFPKKKVQEWAK
jgi:hypothetical protein